MGCFSQAALNVVQPKIQQLANYLDQSTSTASQCTAAAGPGTSFDDAVSDVSSIFRVPDYVSVDIDINAISVGAIPIGDIPIPIGVGGGVVVSDTRYGGVFIEPIASIGTEGPTFQARAGWIESYSVPDRNQVNNFLHGWSAGVSVVAPPIARSVDVRQPSSRWIWIVRLRDWSRFSTGGQPCGGIRISRA